MVDVLTTAHLGLTALYFGDLEKATSAGKLLQKFSALQPDVTQGFYLRISDAVNIITDFPQAVGVFFQVSAIQPNQAYFMIGYPIAFLGNLYQATQNAQYMAAAKEYLNFASTCQNHLYTCYFSHKVAWGAAIIANLTGERCFADLAVRIADYLLSIQGANGAWLQEQPPPCRL